MVEHTYIFATKDKKGGYKAEEIAPTEQIIGDLLSGTEYGDVKEGEIQVWEYPSGKLFAVKPDREVAEQDYYSIASKDLWLPVLEEISEDKAKVRAAYTSLLKKTDSPRGIKRWFKLAFHK
jgi:hypothetical protein